MNKKIVTIKSNKEVVIDTFNNISAFPMCEIMTFTQYEDGFDACGRYFYMDDKAKIEIKTFNRTFLNEQADALFEALNIQYPQDATYSEKRNLEVQAGLTYLVSTEGFWGLKGSDWELVLESNLENNNE